MPFSHFWDAPNPKTCETLRLPQTHTMRHRRESEARDTAEKAMRFGGGGKQNCVGFSEPAKEKT
jgi:hypothetical protein